MTEREVWTSGGRIVVHREMDSGANLTETYKLDVGPPLVLDSMEENPIVHVYVSHKNHDGIPHKSERIGAPTSFSDLPQSVQDEFVESFFKLSEQREFLLNHADWGIADTHQHDLSYEEKVEAALDVLKRLEEDEGIDTWNMTEAIDELDGILEFDSRFDE